VRTDREGGGRRRARPRHLGSLRDGPARYYLVLLPGWVFHCRPAVTGRQRCGSYRKVFHPFASRPGVPKAGLEVVFCLRCGTFPGVATRPGAFTGTVDYPFGGPDFSSPPRNRAERREAIQPSGTAISRFGLSVGRLCQKAPRAFGENKAGAGPNHPEDDSARGLRRDRSPRASGAHQPGNPVGPAPAAGRRSSNPGGCLPAWMASRGFQGLPGRTPEKCEGL